MAKAKVKTTFTINIATSVTLDAYQISDLLGQALSVCFGRDNTKPWTTIQRQEGWTDFVAAMAPAHRQAAMSALFPVALNRNGMDAMQKYLRDSDDEYPWTTIQMRDLKAHVKLELTSVRNCVAEALAEDDTIDNLKNLEAALHLLRMNGYTVAPSKAKSK